MKQRYDHRGLQADLCSLHRSRAGRALVETLAEDPPHPWGIDSPRARRAPACRSSPSPTSVLWQPRSSALKRSFSWTWILLHLSHCQPSKCQTLPLALGEVISSLTPNVTTEIHFKPHWLIGFSCFSADSDARHQRQRDSPLSLCALGIL